jgi:hypothetical protein
LGVYGLATETGIGVLGASYGTDLGVLGEAYGVAVGAEGFSGNSTSPALGSEEGAQGTDLFGTYGYYNPSGSGNQFPENFIIQAGTADNSGDALIGGASDVQISGDVYVNGAVYTACDTFPETNPSVDCDTETNVARSAAGAKIRTYAARQSMKTVEDFGEGALVNGQGYVPLERTFASTIAQNRSYLVYVTPEGDSNGLYVTGRSLAGFTVRESKGGRSSIGFSYRIVAHPYGDSAVRMAAIAPRHVHSTAHNMGFGAHARKFLAHMPRPASIGSRITRPPHNWVKNLHRNN